MPHHHEPPTDPLDPEEQPIIPGRIVVPEDQVEAAQRIIRELQVIDSSELLMSSFGSEELSRADRAAFELITNELTYLELPEEAEGTLQAIDDLHQGGVERARPMFYCWLLNHWAAQPGVKQPIPASPIDMTGWNTAPRTAAWPVWAIDSGYDNQNAWAIAPDGPLKGRVEPDSDIGNAPEHGTFVCALIGVMSPESHIKVLRTDFSHEGGTKSDELAVGVKLRTAIQEYIDKYADRHAVINMSLGTYAALTRSGTHLEPLTIEKQISMAEPYGSKLKLVAAAGNEWSHANKGEVAYPASDSRVTAVGAGDNEDIGTLEWVLWIGEQKEKWVYKPVPKDLKLAPGNNLVAPTGGTLSQWSGSSFAAALLTGHMAATGALPQAQTKDAYRNLLGKPGDSIIP